MKAMRSEERREEWRRQREHADERRAVYLAWKRRHLPSLVALQERMRAGESGSDVLAETARQVKT